MSWGPRAALGSGTRGDWRLARRAAVGAWGKGRTWDCGGKQVWEQGWAVSGLVVGGSPWSGRGSDAGEPSERGRAGPAVGDQPRVLGMQPVDGVLALPLRGAEREGASISVHQRGCFINAPQQTGARSTPSRVSGTSPGGFAPCTPKGKPCWAWGREGLGRTGLAECLSRGRGLLTDASLSQQSLLHPTVVPEILLQEEDSRRCWDEVVEKADHILDTAPWFHLRGRKRPLGGLPNNTATGSTDLEPPI